MEVHTICPGIFHGTEMRWPVPNPMILNTYMEITTRVQVSAKYAALEKTITTVIYGVRSDDDGIKDIEFFEIPKHFTGRDALEPKKWIRYKWVIEPKAFVGKEGGVLQLQFSGLSKSTGPVLYVDEFHRRNRVASSLEAIRDGVFREDPL